jgi:hypothetical protein
MSERTIKISEQRIEEARHRRDVDLAQARSDGAVRERTALVAMLQRGAATANPQVRTWYLLVAYLIENKQHLPREEELNPHGGENTW